MISKTTRLLLLLPLFVLAACSSDSEKPEYQGAKYYKSLEIPPDLTLDTSREEVAIPEPSHSALSDYKTAIKLDQAVLPQFKGVRLKSECGQYWLELDVTPEEAWPKLEAFWENEGIQLQQDEPLLGFMETEWTVRLATDKNASFLTRMFSKMDPDQLDRFRMRVETIDDHKRTRVMVSHAGKERFVQCDDDVDSHVIWLMRPSDPNLEREILARLVLFAGLSENQMDSLLENYHPYQSYVHYSENVVSGDDDQSSLNENNQVAEIIMRGSMDFVWSRTLRALDRLLLTDIAEDRAAGTIGFTSTSDIEMTTDDEPRDELAESSWLMKLFRGSEDKKNTIQRFTLKLTDESGNVRLELLDKNGVQADSARAQQLRQALAQELD
jgi:outer membrane protein assembly factor BamC